MSKKPTPVQVDAWRSLNLAAGALARAIYHMAKAEGRILELGHADVLRELYDAVDAVREEVERKWPGVTNESPF